MSALSPLIEKLKTYPLAIACGVLVLASLVTIFLRLGISDELSIREGELTSRIRAMDQNVKNASNLRQDLADLQALVSSLEERLFDRDERAININFFYDLEEQFGVVFEGINQLPEPDNVYAKDGPRELRIHSTLVFNIEMTGHFENVLRFMQGLHQVPPLIRVADFEISDAGRVENPDQVTANLRLLVLAETE